MAISGDFHMATDTQCPPCTYAGRARFNYECRTTVGRACHGWIG
jgi:hypothetical protein